MKASEFLGVTFANRPETKESDEAIKELVIKIRQDIGRFGSAKIDGGTSVLNVRGRQVKNQLGIDMHALWLKAKGNGGQSWIDKNGNDESDKYSLGY